MRSRAQPPRSAVVQSRSAVAMQFWNPFSGDGGATTLSVTLSFRCEDRGARSILGQIESIAAEADTSTAEGIADLAGDTALMLLRREAEWIASCGSAQHRNDEEQAELALY